MKTLRFAMLVPIAAFASAFSPIEARAQDPTTEVEVLSAVIERIQQDAASASQIAFEVRTGDPRGQGSEFDVYLHDTPDGHLFSRAERAFSSGCVRIERPRDFARMLLRLQSGQEPDSLDPILASGAEKWMKLDRPLPVYLLYFTAWAEEDGTVRFHHDVYGRSEVMDAQAEEMNPVTLPSTQRSSGGS